MSFSDWDDAKERIRQVVDIVDLIGEQIQLKRQGRQFVGLCPWHADARPSLQVNPQRQSWKCWVCDVGGDVFSFVMKREGVEFREALEMLAERAGVTITAERRPAPPPGSPADKKTLYRAMAWASQQYHRYLLEAEEAQAAREYLNERGVKGSSIDGFELGFAPPGWQWLVERAGDTSFSPQVLQAVGLALQSDRTSRWFDRFRGRVLFPIRDTQRRPIGIGGRILPSLAGEQDAKYINSPETRLFSKSEHLYGLDLARDEAARAGEILVMEGYTDVVLAHQSGISNAVAVLGTALGERHLQLLRRYCDRVVLVLDGDTAGQRRTNEILDLFVANQVDLRIVTLPQGLDPCDYLLTYGPEELRQLVAGSVDAWEHKIRTETSDIDIARDTHRAHRALEDLLSTLAKGPRQQLASSSSQRLREQQILNRLARLFRIEETILRQRLKELRQQGPAGRTERPADSRLPSSREQLTALPPLERELLELLLTFPAARNQLVGELADEQLQPVTNEVIRAMQSLEQQGEEPTFERLMLHFDAPEKKNLLVAIDQRAAEKPASAMQEAVDDLRQALQKRKLKKDLAHQQANLQDENLDHDTQREMLKSFFATRQRLNE